MIPAARSSSPRSSPQRPGRRRTDPYSIYPPSRPARGGQAAMPTPQGHRPCTSAARRRTKRTRGNLNASMPREGRPSSYAAGPYRQGTGAPTHAWSLTRSDRVWEEGRGGGKRERARERERERERERDSQQSRPTGRRTGPAWDVIWLLRESLIGTCLGRDWDVIGT